jgi:prepilin-type N-terminal cleavage/methylation domain-containing protein
MIPAASSWQRPRAALGGQRGFTLLELTVAMSFVALLAGGIVLSISTCLKVWRRSLEAADLNQEARAVLETISRDVRGATLGPDRSSGLFQLTPAAQGYPPFDVLELSTESSSVSRLGLLPDELLPADQESRPPVTDYVQVRYEWHEAEPGSPAGLYRTITPVPAPVIRGTQPPLIAPTNAELISTSVTQLRFRCYDNAEWFDEWDAPVRRDRLPAVVLVELAILDQRQREHEFHTLVPIAVR